MVSLIASRFTRSAGVNLLAALFTLALAACAPLYTADAELAAPRSHDEWRTLVSDVRLYQQRIGFEPTLNFRRADADTEGYALCGHGSPLYLPYSMQDPAIRWVDARTEEECRASAGNGEASFAMTEAVAGRSTPVNAKMLVAPVPRFLYLIMHEDCHEQFALPSGIEEALCNMMAFSALEQIAEERFRDAPDDYSAIRRFAQAGAARAAFTSGLYEEVAALYAQHADALISDEALLQQREAILRRAEHRLARPEGALSNVWLATAITYSRHYGVMRRALDAFDGDLARTVEFFRYIDAAKRERRSTATKQRCASAGTLDYVRAYETAIVDAIERALESGDTLELARSGLNTPEFPPSGDAAANGCLEAAAQSQR